MSMKDYSKMTAIELCEESRDILIKQKEAIADISKNHMTTTTLLESYMSDIKRKDELLLECLNLVNGVMSLCERNVGLINFSDRIKAELLGSE